MIDYGAATLHRWVRLFEYSTTAEGTLFKALGRETKELGQMKEIPRQASAIFAGGVRLSFQIVRASVE